MKVMGDKCCLGLLMKNYFLLFIFFISVPYYGNEFNLNERKKSVVMDHVSTLMNGFSTVHNFLKSVHYSKSHINQFAEQYLLPRLRRITSKGFVCKIGTVLAEVQSVVLIQTLKDCPPRLFFHAILNYGASNILSIKSSFISVLEKCGSKEL